MDHMTAELVLGLPECEHLSVLGCGVFGASTIRALPNLRTLSLRQSHLAPSCYNFSNALLDAVPQLASLELVRVAPLSRVSLHGAASLKSVAFMACPTLSSIELSSPSVTTVSVSANRKLQDLSLNVPSAYYVSLNGNVPANKLLSVGPVLRVLRLGGWASSDIARLQLPASVAAHARFVKQSRVEKRRDAIKKGKLISTRIRAGQYGSDSDFDW
eukprot:tig00000581_g2216.t1